MATLNAWQKLTRVLPGKPFGNGADGAYSSATIPNPPEDSCSGSATSTTLTTASATFANGDILLIHQTRGTGVGQWEVNRVVSGGGSTSLTLQVALNYTYTDSGNSQAQAVKILQYTSCTSSGTWTIPSWNENVGGILPIAVRSTLSGSSGTIVATGVGFLNATTTSGDANAMKGEGTAGARSDGTSANGNGGGGGSEGGGGAGGGGGGNASAGSNGNVSSGTAGTGGSAVGDADLLAINLGGGGGGGSGANALTTGGAGGRGGGVFIAFARNIDLTSLTIATNGNNGSNGTGPNNTYHAGGGGGGAGGCVLFVCETATLGTNKITATGGSGGADLASAYNSDGGAGSVGRIAVHHSRTVTGTTNPTFTDVTDTTLKESTSGMFLVF